MGKAKGKEMLFWTKEEYLQFSEVMKDKPVSYYAFEVLYWTGIREGELLALERGDFNIPDRKLTINKSYQHLQGKDYITSPKTEKSNRVIELPEFLCREMEDYFGMLYKCDEHTRLFTFSKSYLHHEMDRGAKAAGVKRIRIHDLRHSHVAHCIELGFSPVAIAERMGHEGINITFNYAHLYPSKQKALADKLNEDRGNLCAFEDDGTTISLTMQATTNYAVNGALHYAKHILQNTTYNKVFAFGNAGDRKHHIIQPLFVDNNGYTWLPEVETFENFSANHILEYYKRIVLKETPPEDIELADILKKAKELHEYLRNYGGLGEDEKPLVVSAILLALREQKYNFRLDMLKGDSLESNTDGAILYQYLEMNLQRAKVSPEVKKARVLNQFTLIKDRPQLNTKRDDLGKRSRKLLSPIFVLIF